jgi:hypothetical protein
MLCVKGSIFFRHSHNHFTIPTSTEVMDVEIIQLVVMFMALDIEAV